MACPFRDDSYACSSHLQDREIRAVSLGTPHCGLHRTSTACLLSCMWHFLGKTQTLGTWCQLAQGWHT